MNNGIDTRLNGMLILEAAKVTARDKKDGEFHRFRMELYRAGYVFRNHWRWGNVVVDLASFTQSRQKIFALKDHNRGCSVGWTDLVAVENKTLITEGVFVQGDHTTEPEADALRRRMAQGAPMQASGGFQPRDIEKILEGRTVTIDGIVHKGPVTVFRKAHLVECSFVHQGWFSEATAQLAASWAESTSMSKHEERPEEEPPKLHAASETPPEPEDEEQRLRDLYERRWQTEPRLREDFSSLEALIAFVKRYPDENI